MKKIIIILFFLASSFTAAQTVIDTLQAFPDTTTFDNEGIKIIGKTASTLVYGFAVKLNSQSGYKLLVSELLVCAIQTEPVTYSISVGEMPEDSILYEGSYEIVDTFPEWQSIKIEPEIAINDSAFFISGFEIFMHMSTSVYNDGIIIKDHYTRFYNDESEKIWWIENEDNGFYFAIKAIVKKEYIGIEDENLSPSEFRIYPNYPNPFNPATTINYRLNKGGEVNLDIFNALGEKVYYENKGFQREGEYKFNWNAAGLPSGVYLVRLSLDNNIKTIKTLLLK